MERCKTQKINIIKKMPKEDFYITANKISLSQVIINILDNSFYFIKEMENAWAEIEIFQTPD